ncbi:MAG: histidine kinase [Flavobacteriales bacterium]|nr:histidine kinase [Flavobacteriales bacterium]
MLKHLLPFYLFFVSTVFVSAQSDIVHFENITREDGLAQSTINGILEGKDGFMWFATAEGLHRFDGYEFKIYKHDNKNPNSLISNHITALYEDNEGYLWVGTYNGGLDKFDKKSQKFTHFLIASLDSTENQFPVNCIKKDSRGNLLVGLDGNGLVLFNETSKSWQIFTKENSKLPNNYVNAIEPEAAGTGLWIGTMQGIILLKDGGFKQFSSLKLFENQAINSIYHHLGKVYFATSGQGLQIWDTKTDEVIPIPSPRIRGANFMQFILHDNEGNLWIGTDGAGLLKFNGEKFVNYRNNPFDFQSLVGDDLLVGYKDKTGALWFGCRDGISKYDPNMKLFNLYTRFEHDEKLTNNNIYSIYETADKHVWLGTLGGGLAEFNPETEELRVIPEIKSGHIETKSVRAIFEDKFGILWIGTRDEGLFSYDRKTNKFTHYPPQREEINVKTIRNIIEDEQGNLWLATRWGLAKFDRKTKKYIVFKNGYLNNNPIYQIIEDPKRDELILVTFRTGLQIFNKTDSVFSEVLFHTEDSTSPNVNAMMCIEAMGNDLYLIGTYAGGLNIFDRKTLKFKHLTSEQGLPNDVIYGILKSDNNTYWLSSNNGLIEYNSSKNSFKAYTLSNYLQGLEFNEGAYWKTKDNTFYFGGLHGFNYFKTASVHKKEIPPKVALTSFKKMDKEVNLEMDINYLDKILLSHNENLISFGFSALSYNNSHQSTYQYMLEGFDNQWIEAGTRHTAYYTHLSPGTYTFRVKAANHQGVWSNDERTIKVVVEPPYWQTWWFRLLIALALIALILLIFRFRTRSISKSYQHKLVDLELKALRSQMNPHFIFNSLNSIQYFVLKNEPKAAYTYLTKFSSLMRMILQNSRVKYITLKEERDWLYTYLELEKLRMENQLEFSIEVEDELNEKQIFVPSMLIQPYIENAIIHGLLPKEANRNLTVHFRKKQNKLECTIEDNGIGREQSAILNQNRTKKHKSQGIKVTGERLEILTQDMQEKPEFNIVDLYDENNNPIGTRVTLILPIIKDIKDKDA